MTLITRSWIAVIFLINHCVQTGNGIASQQPSQTPNWFPDQRKNLRK